MTARCIAVAALLVATAWPNQQTTRDAPAERPKGTAIIAGTVFLGATGSEPARRTRVTLNANAGRILGRTTTTDESGRFVFRDVPAARFTIQAAKPGYLTASYGARRPGRAGTAVPVADAAQVTGLTLRLIRGSVIAGTALDASGRPAPGVPITVLRFGYGETGGERTLSAQSSAAFTTTDDRGVYRAWGLPPGDYVVMATPLLGSARGSATDFQQLTTNDVTRALTLARGRSGGPAPPPSSAPRVNYAPVFFPGTPDVSLATTITLKEAEERTGIDLSIRLFRTARIEGRVRMADGGALPTVVPVALTPGGPQADLLGRRPGRTRTSRVDRDGKVQFYDVTPGRYLVTANTAAPAGRGGPPPTNVPAALWAMADVTVDGADVVVDLELQPAMRATGRIVFDGTSDKPKDLTAIRFVMVPPGSVGNLSAGPPGGQVTAEGTFTFTNILPGSYRLLSLGGYPGWVIRSAVINGQDQWDSWLPIGPGEDVDWTITFTDRPTEITGALQDAAGRPVPEHTILIFPADRSRWIPGTTRIRSVRPGTDGQYQAAGLPPGDYLLVALTDVEPGEWNDPAFLEALVPAGIRISLAEGQKKRQDLRIR